MKTKKDIKVPQNEATSPSSEETNQKLLRGVQGGGFLEKSPPGRRRHYFFNAWENQSHIFL